MDGHKKFFIRKAGRQAAREHAQRGVDKRDTGEIDGQFQVPRRKGQKKVNDGK